MVAFISKTFCNELRYSPAFKFSDAFFTHSQPSDQPLKLPLWLRQFRSAERIDPEPTDLKAIRRVHPDVKYPATPDFISIGSIPVVSEAFRQIMRDLEPDKHQFVPVALVDEKAHSLVGPYWLLNVLQCCDAVIKREQIKKWYAEKHRIPEVDRFWLKNKDGSRLSQRSSPFSEQGSHRRPASVAPRRRRPFRTICMFPMNSFCG